MTQPTGNQRENGGFTIGLIMGIPLSLVFATAFGNWFLGVVIGMFAGVILYGGWAYRQGR
jgi:hypothetical protein